MVLILALSESDCSQIVEAGLDPNWDIVVADSENRFHQFHPA